MLQKVEAQSDLYDSPTFVELGNLEDYVTEDGTVLLDMPNGIETLVFKPTYIDQNSSHGDLLWAGKSDTGNSYLVSMRQENATGAMLVQNGKGYQIAQTPHGKHVMVATKSNLDFDVSCGNPSDLIPPSDSGIDPTCSDDYSTCPAIINILFLITEGDVATNFSSLFDLNFYTGIQEALTNFAIKNSAIPNKQVRIKTEVLSSFDFQPANTQNGFIPNLLMAEYDLTTLSNVANINFREQRGADLVFLLQNGQYSTINIPGDGGLLGLAIEVVESPDPNLAYGMFDIGLPLEFMVFQHELGHLFGCHHAWKDTGGSSEENVCNHAVHRYNLIGENEEEAWGTIVAEGLFLAPTPFIYFTPIDDVQSDVIEHNIVSYSVIPNYSNPLVYHNTQRTGDLPNGFPRHADNAQAIQNNGCPIANYTGGQGFGFLISELEPCLDWWVADITQPDPGSFGQPPYSYTWQTSSTGIFNANSPIISTVQSALVDDYPNTQCKFWLRCLITTSDNHYLHSNY